MEKYYRVMREKLGIDISVYDHSYLEKSIRNRINTNRCATQEDYLSVLTKNPDEPTQLVQELGNSHSEFFRNSLTFSMLEQIVLPRIFDEKQKKQSNEIRIWSAGCAAGQEAYSLAMLVEDYKNMHHSTFSSRIFATDNSSIELDHARKGMFDFKAVKKTKLEFAEKYFSHKGDKYVLDKKIKEQVDFSLYDLLDPGSSSPPSAIYGDFDLIMCSNVLFYYEPEYQQMILRKFFRSLKHGGFFITGEAETHILNSFGSFRQYDGSAAIYIKN